MEKILKNKPKNVIKIMKGKALVLLNAMEEMKKLLKFQDNVHDLLRLEVYELQPSLTAGTLFDLLTDQLLDKNGVDLLDEFMFGGIPEEYGEDNPFVITEKDEENGLVKNEITNCKAMCEYLEKNNYFK